jgi:hypothetical protein
MDAAQDFVAADIVLAIHHGCFLNQVDFPAKHCFQLALHAHQVKQPAPGCLVKGNQDINVALDAKILPQSRPKNSQLGHPPALAKLADLFFWYLNGLQHGVNHSSVSIA